MGQWAENRYCQYFSGEKMFACGQPCGASELVHFRRRIGETGIELILQESIRVNGGDGNDPQVNVDTTVQEKNITYPTNDKLYKMIIKKCQLINGTGAIAAPAELYKDAKEIGRRTAFPPAPQKQG